MYGSTIGVLRVYVQDIRTGMELKLCLHVNESLPVFVLMSIIYIIAGNDTMYWELTGARGNQWLNGLMPIWSVNPFKVT